MRILHVIEAYGGGVAAAVADYIESTAELDHWILRAARPAFDMGEPQGLAGRIADLPASRLRHVSSVRHAVESLRPDVVHAHSSLAGAYVRSPGVVRRGRVVYTPHCFAFERRDVLAPVRASFWTVEALLSFRPAVIAAVSAWEAALARRLPGRPHVVEVPNIASALPTLSTHSRSNGHRPVVVGVGRVCRQKDPDFFAAAARAAPDLDWVWVGGGDEAGEGGLRAAGVRVTGWLERSAVLDELATADVYVHTAAWEGAPLSILEAARAGCPVVARKIAPLRALEPGFLASNPSELADCARRVALDASMRAAAIARGRRLLLACNREAQADALRAAYRSRAPSRYPRPVLSEAVECGAE